MLKKIRHLLLETGAFDAMYAVHMRSLFVLAYHRITDHDVPDFDTFKPNVSASPEDFAEQMDFIRERFNVIALDDLLAWLRGEAELPRFPVLITFDDGYRDNFTHAFPILRERNLPAVIFLTSNAIENTEPFWWDMVAYCFFHTSLCEAELPLVGRKNWHAPGERNTVMRQYLDALKQVPEYEKRAAVQELPQKLEVTVDQQRFADMFLTWDHVRTMVAQRVAMGAHTQDHPIMTRIPLEKAREEAIGSRARIEAETGQTVLSFAYTNGLASDFNRDVQDMLREEGFQVAFTLLHGPANPVRVRNEPMAIQRIAISYKDTLSRFAVKLLGRP